MICATIEDVARRTGISAYAKRASAVVLLSVSKKKNNAGVTDLTEGEGVGTASGYTLTQPTLTI